MMAKVRRGAMASAISSRVTVDVPNSAISLRRLRVAPNAGVRFGSLHKASVVRSQRVRVVQSDSHERCAMGA